MRPLFRCWNSQAPPIFEFLLLIFGAGHGTPDIFGGRADIQAYGSRDSSDEENCDGTCEDAHGGGLPDERAGAYGDYG